MCWSNQKSIVHDAEEILYFHESDDGGACKLWVRARVRSYLCLTEVAPAQIALPKMECNLSICLTILSCFMHGTFVLDPLLVSTTSKSYERCVLYIHGSCRTRDLMANYSFARSFQTCSSCLWILEKISLSCRFVDKYNAQFTWWLRETTNSVNFITNGSEMEKIVSITLRTVWAQQTLADSIRKSLSRSASEKDRTSSYSKIFHSQNGFVNFSLFLLFLFFGVVDAVDLFVISSVNNLFRLHSLLLRFFSPQQHLPTIELYIIQIRHEVLW